MISKVDTNKLLEPIRPNITLEALGEEIRALAKLEGDTRLAMCLRLAMAKPMCISQGLNWEGWCKANVLTPKGHPFQSSTIENYVRMGQANDPVKALETQRHKSREVNRSRMKEIRGSNLIVPRTGSAHGSSLPHAKYAKVVAGIKASLSPAEVASKAGVKRPMVYLIREELRAGKVRRSPEEMAEDQQLNLLMHAWERAVDRVRAQFLHNINARPIR